jgi:hypothetical protein
MFFRAPEEERRSDRVGAARRKLSRQEPADVVDAAADPTLVFLAM